MWYPFLLLVALAIVPVANLGTIGFAAAVVTMVVMGTILWAHRITISSKELLVILGGLLLFNAPFNMQRIAYQLLTIATVALFFLSLGRLNRRQKLWYTGLTVAAILAIMARFSAVHGTVFNGFAEWAIIAAVPFYFLVRLVDRGAFTVVMCIAFGFLQVVANNVVGLVFPVAVLLAWLLPGTTRVSAAFAVAIVVSCALTWLAVKYAILIPHQGMFMRAAIWNEMLLHWASSPTSMMLGVDRFNEVGYVWRSDALLLFDSRGSGTRYILFSEMTHNYLLAILVFGGLKGILVVGLICLRYFKGLVFEQRSDLAIFIATFVYLTFGGSKFLSPDGVSISSAILIYSSVHALRYFGPSRVRSASTRSGNRGPILSGVSGRSTEAAVIGVSI